MPELPDVTVYIEALERRILGQPLEGVRLASPFLLRTVDAADQRPRTAERVRELRRLGKRIALGLGTDDLWLVLHLMIAGRLHWKEPGAKLAGRYALAAFDFPARHADADRGRRQEARIAPPGARRGRRSRRTTPAGSRCCEADLAAFRAALARENHTLKRALTDPRLFSGIGNAYSDEILHRARLSPLAMTAKLTAEEIARLYEATRADARRLDRTPARPVRRRVPREGHRVPARDGGARQVRQALPGLRHAGAAHPLRRQRDQLLPALPDRRPAARRPLASRACSRRLADDDRRARAARVARRPVDGA